MSQVFISYSHKDKDFVQYLAYRLAEQNVAFWVDDDRLYGGVVWQDEITSGLFTSDVLILVVTPDSMKSKAVEKEWKYFYNHKKPIIPIIIKDAEIADELQEFQWINNFTKVGGFQSGFNRLIESLEQFGVSINPRQSLTDFGIDSFAESIGFRVSNIASLIHDIRALNHTIRLCFPIKFTLPLEFTNYPTHYRTLKDLCEARIWWRNDLLNEVSLNLQALKAKLSINHVPYFMKDFWGKYEELVASRWIKVMYLDNVEYPYVVETLPYDETLLNDLFNSAKELSEEFNRLMNKVLLPPKLFEYIQTELSNANLRLHGAAPVSIPNSETYQQPHSYCRVHCGFIRLDWIDMPTSEEQQLAQSVTERFFIERYWFLSSLNMPIISP